MNRQHDLPELSKYSELSSDEQVAIHQMLISYVRSDHFYNIILTHNVEPYDLVKLVVLVLRIETQLSGFILKQ